MEITKHYTYSSNVNERLENNFPKRKIRSNYRRSFWYIRLFKI